MSRSKVEVELSVRSKAPRDGLRACQAEAVPPSCAGARGEWVGVKCSLDLASGRGADEAAARQV